MGGRNGGLRDRTAARAIQPHSTPNKRAGKVSRMKSEPNRMIQAITAHTRIGMRTNRAFRSDASVPLIKVGLPLVPKNISTSSPRT